MVGHPGLCQRGSIENVALPVESTFSIQYSECRECSGAFIGCPDKTGKLRIEGFVINLTGDVHEAAQIITEFDNTRFFTRPKLA